MIRRSTSGAIAVLALLGLPADGAVHLLRRGDGSAMIFNDIGSGWRVNGHAPSDAYLLCRRDVATPYDTAIREHATRRGIDARLVRSVILVESNFNPAAVSCKGARGLMQLMPDTARHYGVKDIHDAVDNIRGGVAYLADLLTAHHGDVPLALAAYNAGLGAVRKHAGVPPYPETREYVRRTMLAYAGGADPGPGPLLAGAFRGLTAMPAKAETLEARRAPVRLELEEDSAVISNTGVGHRAAPVLGRVRTGETRRVR